MTHTPQAILEQLRRVLATALDAPVQLVPGTMAASGWRLRVTASGQPPVNLTFDAEGATALAVAMVTWSPIDLPRSRSVTSPSATSRSVRGARPSRIGRETT